MTAIKRLNRWRGGAVAAVLAGAILAALITIENALPAREEAKAAALPPDLAKIPTDGAFLLSARVADLWNSELGKPVREKLAKDLGEPVREFEKFFGLSLEQIERLTMVLIDPPPSREEPLLFMYTTKAYDKAKVIPADNKDKEQKYKGKTFYLKEKDGAVYPIDDRTLVYGKPESIRSLIDHPAPKSAGNLAGALRTAAGKHALTIGFNVKAFNDSVGNMLPDEIEPFKPLLKANLGTLAVDVAAESRADMTLTFASEADAKAGAKPLQDGINLAAMALDRGIAELAKEERPGMVEWFKHMQAALKAAKVSQQGKTLQASASLKVDVRSVGVFALEAVQQTRGAASRTASANNLRQIALAMHNFADTTRRLPAQATYNKNGKPMLSWRVLILPYIEQNELYKEFHLDEPWDSEHNKKLLAKMPKTYASPYDENTLKDHTTYYQGFVGKGAFFEGKQGLRFPADFPDGTSNTIMIVEGVKAVPWTKPEDIPYDPAKPLPKLGRPGAKGFQAALCDGSVRFIANTIKEMTLRNAITRNDGNPIGDDF